LSPGKDGFVKVIVVDGDRNFARELADILRSEGQEFQTFHFGSDHQGYELCRWLREHHPFGLLLPIVYLTSDETPEHFLERQAEAPFTHPSAFVPKSQLAVAGFLPRLLKQHQEQFERVRLLAEQQGARQALLGLAAMDPDIIDAP
jgi:hypothetical protein